MTSDLGFKYSILASGSTGNSFYLETPEKKILVDAGLSGKKITSLLAEIDRDPSDLDAILVTHEHKDHIHGVGVLARKYGRLWIVKICLARLIIARNMFFLVISF